MLRSSSCFNRVLRERNLLFNFDSSLFSLHDTAFKMEDLTYEETLTDTKTAFLAGVSAVRPYKLVKEAVQWSGSVLKIKDTEFQVKRPCHVVGFGKAVLEMALAMEEILGGSMKSGIVSVPLGSKHTHSVPSNSRIEILEGALNNLPDRAAESNAKRILNDVQNLETEDTVLVLISGGGSALLPLPKPPITLDEKLLVIKLLANAGADISQLNCVRKHISCVKGGRLAVAAQPATVLSLILSDVIGDPIDIIASGPTSTNTDSLTAAWEVICQFNLQNCIPPSVQLCLTAKKRQPVEEKNLNVHNIVIGNNSIAICTVLEKMLSLGFSGCALSNSIQGDVAKVSLFYAILASQICQIIENGHGSLLEGVDQTIFSNAQSNIMKAVREVGNEKGVCIVAGGETTVNVTGKGIGGRNQELALRFAAELRNMTQKQPIMTGFRVSLLSAGTDGIDGPTNAAGAFGYADQLNGEQDHINYIINNDSNTFYSKLNSGRNLINVGHTGTNVMDIHILTIQKKGERK